MTEYQTFVLSRFKKLDTLAGSFLHAAVGLAGELGEIQAAETPDNLMEELGDFHFYLTAAECLLLDLGFRLDTETDEYDRMPYCVVFTGLQMQSAEFLDAAKKGFIYNKPLDMGAIKSLIIELREIFSQYLGYHFVTLNLIEYENTQKLLKRYPTGYSDLNAQLRADKAQS
jgi:hypothetical protein